MGSEARLSGRRSAFSQGSESATGLAGFQGGAVDGRRSGSPAVVSEADASVPAGRTDGTGPARAARFEVERRTLARRASLEPPGTRMKEGGTLSTKPARSQSRGATDDEQPAQPRIDTSPSSHARSDIA